MHARCNSAQDYEAPYVEEHGGTVCPTSDIFFPTAFGEQNPPQIQISAWWFCVHNSWVNISPFQHWMCFVEEARCHPVSAFGLGEHARCPHLYQDIWSITVDFYSVVSVRKVPHKTRISSAWSIGCVQRVSIVMKNLQQTCQLFWVCFQYCCPTSKGRETLAEDLICWTGSTGNWTPDGMRKPEWCVYLFICGRCLS